MKCTGKEWDTCRVEKMGCRGCYYDEKKFLGGVLSARCDRDGFV